ncbi:MAG: multiheme c-type cytochrome [Pirellulaceae bacterium]|nr:multiheme c-type cytochrome [Pirellulaceae bacterium]
MKILSILNLARSFVGLAFCGLAIFVVASTARGDTPGLSASPTVIGVKECAACHSAPSPIYEQLEVTSFIRLTEASEWLQNDKHAQAYELIRLDLTEEELNSVDRISNQRSRDICQKLGWSKGDGNFEKQCLTCHAGLDHRTTLDANTSSLLRFGVQCEACHGPGSIYTRIENHQQTTWREKTPLEKSELGMLDLASPSVAAKVCWSCHLGNIEQHRFVTHPMYAAGHPPLPPVDLQVFQDAMPPHWKELKDKPLSSHVHAKSPTTFAKQQEYYQARFGIVSATDADYQSWRDSYDRTRRSMLGSIAANDVGIQLIHDAAERPELWGDFAIYDCTGCHHELSKSKPRWRPLDRTPGRAYPAMWWSLEYDSKSSEQKPTSSTLSQEVLSAFDRVPFGDRRELVASSSAHADALRVRHQARQSMEQKPMTESEVRDWLVHLLESRREMLGDYWTAKQTAWMFQVAVRELVDHQAISDNPSLNKLDELSKELNLSFRIEPRTSVLVNLEERLEKSRTFDERSCLLLFEELAKIVATK